MKIEKQKNGTYTISDCSMGKLLAIKNVLELKTQIAALTPIQRDIYTAISAVTEPLEKELQSL